MKIEQALIHGLQVALLCAAVILAINGHPVVGALALIIMCILD